MYLFFIILLVSLLIIFILTRKNSWSTRLLMILYSILSISILIEFFSMFFKGIPPTRTETEIWYQNTPWKHAILFVVMLLGMVTNYFFELVQARIKAKESNGQVQLPKFIWEKLVLPLLIAGILFGYFWGEHSHEPMELTVILISYQNGFFWQTILAKLKS